MQITSNIKQLFQASNGVLTSRALEAQGVSRYFIKKMLDNEEIEIVKRGIYKLNESNVHEFTEVLAIAPRGIFSLYSSALIHGLSTFIPSDYHIAIPKKSKLRLPDYPPIQLYYWDKYQYQLGIENLTKDGIPITIYDAEKTVCDFIKFRHKTGLDTTKEVLNTYLNSNKRNIDKLVKYSHKLRIRTVIDKYLEILV